MVFNWLWSLETNELILVISLIITVIIHAILMYASYRRERFQRFDKLAQKILATGTSIKDYDKEHYPLWDNAILNQAEYIAYLVNRRELNFKLVAGYLDDALIDYFENILKKNKKDLKNKKKYPEFKKLYKKLKKNKARKKFLKSWFS